MSSRCPSLLALAPLAAVAALALGGGCRRDDPKKDLQLSGLETYWVVEAPKGQTQAIAPAIRLTLTNVSNDTLDSIQAAGAFRREGEDWGGDWQQVASGRKPLLPGKSIVVVLRSGEGRYTSTGEPEEMLRVDAFRDAVATVHLRVGTSAWVQVASATVERRIGAQSVQGMR